MKKYLNLILDILLSAVIITAAIPKPYAFALRPAAYRLSKGMPEDLLEGGKPSQAGKNKNLADFISFTEDLQVIKDALLKRIPWAVEIAERVYGQKKFDLARDTYIGHTSRVAYTVMQLNPDIDELTLAAALLHKVDPQTLNNKLNSLSKSKNMNKKDRQNIIELVETTNTVSNLAYLPENKKSGRAIQNQMNMIIQLAGRPECMLLVFADKFNVLRSAAQSQQDYVFREITNIYAPLAERLGLRGLALQFRDEVFRHAKKADFEKTENDIKRVLGVDRNHALAHMEKKKKSVEEKLKEKNIRAQVNVRVKGAYSTFEKIVSRDDIKSVDDVYDLLGIEIVFSNEADMWSGSDLPESYGKVIQSMRETKRYEEDRITVLHNTVKDEQGRYYEFQLMTDDSHQKLQYGPRAHWLYKLERETGQQFDADFVVRTDDFFKDFESVKNSLDDYIFVFIKIEETDGIRLKPIRMPRGSIPSDFAALKSVDTLNPDYGGILEYMELYDILHNKPYPPKKRLCKESAMLKTGMVLEPIWGNRFKNIKDVRSFRLSKAWQAMAQNAKTYRARLMLHALGGNISEYAVRGKAALEKQGIIIGRGSVGKDLENMLIDDLGLKNLTELYAISGVVEISKNQGSIIDEITQKTIKNGIHILEEEGIDINNGFVLEKLDGIYSRLPLNINTPRQLLIAVGCGRISARSINSKLMFSEPMDLPRANACGTAA